MQAATAVDGCVWFAGAWSGPFPNEVAVKDVWKYCESTDSWSVVTSIPRARGSAGSVFYNGKLYLVSGNQGGHNPDAKLVPFFDCYDPVDDKWTILPDIPHCKFFHFFMFTTHCFRPSEQYLSIRTNLKILLYSAVFANW